MVITDIFEIMSDNFKQCVKEKAWPRRMVTTYDKHCIYNYKK